MFFARNRLDAGFVQKTLFLLMVVGLSLLALKLIGIWLLVFGAVVVATVLRATAEPLVKYLKLKDSWAVLLALLFLVSFLAASGWLFGSEIVRQTNNLSREIPEAWAQLQVRLRASDVGATLLDQINGLSQQASGVLSLVPKIAGEIASSVANLLVVVVAGIFMAMQPRSYRDGVVRLFPRSQKDRVRDGLNLSGKALRLWLLGQLFSMVLVGSLTAIGLSIAGVPSAGALGLMSGLAQFVPIVGPVVSAGPGLLLAASENMTTFVAALVIYVGVSQLESNIITPMVQKHVAAVPTVITLFAVLGFGSLLGPLGVLFATPLTVVAHTLVMKFYVGEVLGDHGAEAEVSGEAET
ncbi:AI-2E family transporter [Asticcacaulis sp. DW145]|jgi:predicted PurR-regulated permease PerM|uniref:AI-2E family transporter n=1 Tax=Asticcacaulis currens TaxID=2984210 RepID=A0ABT5IFL7_9CAUL|nr:AI-2E family transporter [Asticcacaulis currens]MDC7694708.1 AI-2E family transporter [Asticcacaulis currens]BEV11134.1 AI-2E family transporter [Asticcacaulis sp. DW145]